jgi:ferredoxin
MFEIRDDVAVVLQDSVPKDLEATCKDAVESCPVSAISIEG